MPHILKTVVVTGLILVTGCIKINIDKNIVQDQVVVQTTKKLDVALLIPLTGNNKDVGKNMLDSANLALSQTDEINLTVVDTGSLNRDNPDAIKLLEAKKFDIVLGPLFSSQTKVIYNKLINSGTLIFSFSNDDGLKNHRNLYILGTIVHDCIGQTVDYALSKGYDKAIVMLPNNNYGLSIEDFLTKKTIDSKLNITKIIKYNNDTNFTLYDSLDTIKEILIRDPNSKHMIIFPEGGKALKVVTTNLKPWCEEHKIDIRFLGSNQWDQSDLLNFKELDGSWIAQIPMSKIASFDKKFESAFNYKPFKIASLAYDGVMIANDYANNHLINKEWFLDSGDLKFNSDGTNQRKYNIYEFKNNKFIELRDQLE